MPQKVKHRAALDEALRAEGRDPETVGMIFEVIAVVGETEREALAHRDLLLTAVPPDAVGAFMSHRAGYDFSKLPARFTPGDLNREIAASNASPVGLVHQVALAVGESTEMTREEFFEFGLRFATGHDHMVAGTAAQVADFLAPELQRRGRFRTRYHDRTLKENLAAA